MKLIAIAVSTVLAAILGLCQSGQSPQSNPLPASLRPLQAIIQKLQVDNVKESCSETDCFTDIDYKSFQNDHRAQQIAEEQRRSSPFLKAARALGNLSEDKRQAACELLRQPYRKTWAQLVEVSCKGQTVAGNKAERDIANALVDAALEVSRTRGTIKK
ncbi:MAG: hypothetical protein ABSG65_22265 [Bryobacteraceae bacterium]|jgi:hypothetical protein